MRLALMIASFVISSASRAQTLTPGDPNVTRLAFGSCAQEDQPQPIWDQVIKESPDAFLMIGDNIYGDTNDPQVLRAKYDQLGAKPEFQRARAAMPFFATWDDHDYGRNDAGREYPIKRESQTAFQDFWGIPLNDPLRSREGVYSSVYIGGPGRMVQVILLDTRYFRGPLKRWFGKYVPDYNPGNTMLGETQWSWLEKELLQPAEVRIIASSIQVVSNQHGFESWGTMPRERDRLLNLITKTRAKGVIFVSGDRHHGEVSRLPGAGQLYSLYDVTSSGLSLEGHGSAEDRADKNPYRIDPVRPYAGINFGSITVFWEAAHGPQIEAIIHDDAGKPVTKTYIPLNSLRFDTDVLETPITQDAAL